MFGWIFWLVMLVICAFLWWASFYATKDMRIKKNLMRREQARKNLQAAEQKKAETANMEDH
jgi:hypothetical protein